MSRIGLNPRFVASLKALLKGEAGGAQGATTASIAAVVPEDLEGAAHDTGPGSSKEPEDEEGGGGELAKSSRIMLPLRLAQQLGLFQQVAVKPHMRRTRSGRVVQVRGHQAQRGKAQEEERSRRAPSPEEEFKALGPRAPAFKRWFGDWEKGEGSRVVKRDGSPAEQHGPLTVFHGTAVGGFRAFDTAKDKGHNLFGRGIYFTEDREIAESYTEKDANEAIYQATGFRGPDGQEITTIPAKDVPELLYRAGGIVYQGFDPGKPEGWDRRPRVDPPLRSTRWPWQHGKIREWGQNEGLRLHGNNSPNVLYAVHKASDEHGNVNLPDFLRYFWNPDPVDLAAAHAAQPAKGRWEVYDGLGSDMRNQRSAIYQLARHLLPEGSQPITPDAQVFEVYLNIRNPLDMDAPVDRDKLQQFSVYLRDQAVARAAQSARSARAEAAEWRERVRLIDEEGVAWGRKVDAEEAAEFRQQFVADAERLEEYQRKGEEAERLLAAMEFGWAWAEDVLPSRETVPGVIRDEFSGSIGVTYESLLALKRWQVDRTKGQTFVDPISKQTRPVMPLLHRSSRDTLTWADVQYIISEGHRGGEQKHFDDWARVAGYDGIRHTGGWNIGTKEHVVWIAFEPNQIKATTNRGTFSPDTDDLYKGAEVRSHTRRTKTGKVVQVRQHTRAVEGRQGAQEAPRGRARPMPPGELPEGHTFTTGAIMHHGARAYRVGKVRDGVAQLAPADGGASTSMPAASLPRFYNDLNGVVYGTPNSDHHAVNEVIAGRAEWVGKGNDGMVWRYKDVAVKADTTVPYQPMNRGHRTPQEAARHLAREHAAHEALHGLPLVPPCQMVKHEGRAYLVKPWAETRNIEATLTEDDLARVRETIEGMHARGWALGDTIQLGRVDGRLYLLDLGQAHPGATEHQMETDRTRLADLFRARGKSLLPTGKALEAKEEQYRFLVEKAIAAGRAVPRPFAMKWEQLTTARGNEILDGGDVDAYFDFIETVSDIEKRLKEASK